MSLRSAHKPRRHSQIIHPDGIDPYPDLSRSTSSSPSMSYNLMALCGFFINTGIISNLLLQLCTHTDALVEQERPPTFFALITALFTVPGILKALFAFSCLVLYGYMLSRERYIRSEKEKYHEFPYKQHQGYYGENNLSEKRFALVAGNDYVGGIV